MNHAWRQGKRRRERVLKYNQTMKHIVICVAFVLAGATGCMKAGNQSQTFEMVSSVAWDEYDTVMKQDLFCLAAGYPGFITGIDIDGDNVYIEMRSGRRILYDDHKEKTAAERLANPDLQDMLEQIYSLSAVNSLSEPFFDPGRARVYDLFREVYGNNRHEIEKNLVNVLVGNGCCRFNCSNGAAENLEEVFSELFSLGRKNPAVYSYISPVSGTFNYRNISGTTRLSSHAFGTAIDMAVNMDDYWRWATREQGAKRIRTYPAEIVETFERHGFIWGGKWGHFDIMHYEYRPEIILKAKYFTEKTQGENWYGDIELYDSTMTQYIDMIEEVFEKCNT